MTIVIRILKQATVNPGPPLPASITAEFAIRDDATSSTWYRYRKGNIPSATSDIQAFLDAEGASLYSEAVGANASDPAKNPTMTQNQVDTQFYLWQHFDHREIFGFALYKLEDGIRTSTGTLPNYQTILGDALGVITGASLLAGFTTHLTNERTAQALNIAPGTMTLAQCRAFDELLHIWLNARLVSAVYAFTIGGVTQI